MTDEQTEGGATRGRDADLHLTTAREEAAGATQEKWKDGKADVSDASREVTSRHTALSAEVLEVPVDKEETWVETTATLGTEEETTAWVDMEAAETDPPVGHQSRGVARPPENAEGCATTQNARPTTNDVEELTTVLATEVPTSNVATTETAAEAPPTTTFERVVFTERATENDQRRDTSLR
jgi:hypothetical protein